MVPQDGSQAVLQDLQFMELAPVDRFKGAVDKLILKNKTVGLLGRHINTKKKMEMQGRIQGIKVTPRRMAINSDIYQMQIWDFIILILFLYHLLSIVHL